MGLHTLCLLDIKVKEQTVENLMKGNKIFEPPRYMKEWVIFGYIYEKNFDLRERYFVWKEKWAERIDFVLLDQGWKIGSNFRLW